MARSAEPALRTTADSSALDATSPEAGEALPLYLREIGRVPLLTASDEVRLSQAIERGREAADRLQAEDPAVHAGQRLSEADRDELECVVREGDLAREALTDANLRLVVSVARRYSNLSTARISPVFPS